MFCTNCGSSIIEYSNFCSKCGQQQGNNSNRYSRVNLVNGQINNINGSIAINNVGQFSILKSNYLEIFKTFFIGMLFVVLGAFFGANFLPASIISIINILFVIFMVASIFLIKRDLFKTKVSMNIYCFILGIILSITLVYYFDYLGSGIFISSVLGVCAIFAVAFWHASKSSEEDIFSTGPILFKCMIALIIFEILNIFLFGFGLFDIVLSGFAIAIYSGYTLYVMKGMQVKCSNELLEESDIVTISISLITSFLNLLLHILRLIAATRSND